MPEDLTVAARNQAGLHAATVEWLELARGFNREVEDAEVASSRTSPTRRSTARSGSTTGR